MHNVTPADFEEMFTERGAAIYTAHWSKKIEVEVLMEATYRVGHGIKRKCVVYQRLDKPDGVTVRESGEFHRLYTRKNEPTKLDEPPHSNPS